MKQHPTSEGAAQEILGNETPLAQSESTSRGLHSLEPWEYIRDSFFSADKPDHTIRNANDLVVTVKMRAEDMWNAKTEANFNRIVSCVNALAGAQNPAAIPQLIKAVKIVRATALYHHNLNHFEIAQREFADVMKALAALDSPQKEKEDL